MKIKSIKFFVSLFLLVCLFSAVCINKPFCLALLTKIQSHDGIGALCALSIIYIFSNLLMLPLGLPLNLLAGMLWGTLGGGILINLLATFVAAISFGLGRWLGYSFLDAFFNKNKKLLHIKSAINRYDWQFIALARINPIVPFGLSNYLFGMIPGLLFKHYLIVTAIANLIPCLAFASLGSLLKIFSFTNGNIENLIFKVGIALLFLTGLFALKVILLPKQGKLRVFSE